MGAAVVGTAYVYDRQFNASAVARSLRTGYIGVLCTLDCECPASSQRDMRVGQRHRIGYDGSQRPLLAGAPECDVLNPQTR